MTTLDYNSYELLDEPNQHHQQQEYYLNSTSSSYDDDNDDDLTTYYSLSEAQDKTLSLIPIFSGLISAYGSICIIRMVLRYKRIVEITCYKRIMLGLSSADIVSSLTSVFQAFLVPADAPSPRIWAVGNDTTCSMMGFFQQVSTSIFWYNGMLSFYYLLTIRYAISETKMKSTWEPIMHFLSIGFPLVTAILLAGFDSYGEYKIGHWCWITGDNALLLTYATAGIPIFFFLLIAIPINNIVVYCHVRKTVNNNNKGINNNTILSSALYQSSSVVSGEFNSTNDRGEGGGDGDGMTTPAATTTTTNTTVIMDLHESFESNLSDDDFDGIIPTTEQLQQEIQRELEDQKRRQEEMSTILRSQEEQLQGEFIHGGDDLIIQDQDQQEQSQQQQPQQEITMDDPDYESGESAITSPSVSSGNLSTFSNEELIKREIQREVQNQQQQRRRQHVRLKRVALQATLYVVGVMICNLPTLVLRVLGGAGLITPHTDESKFFPLLVLQAIFLPLQGLFNYIIFARFSTSYVREME